MFFNRCAPQFGIQTKWKRLPEVEFRSISCQFFTNLVLSTPFLLPDKESEGKYQWKKTLHTRCPGLGLFKISFKEVIFNIRLIVSAIINFTFNITLVYHCVV